MKRFRRVGLFLFLVAVASSLSCYEMMIGVARLTQKSERIAKITGVEGLHFRKEVKLSSDVMGWTVGISPGVQKSDINEVMGTVKVTNTGASEISLRPHIGNRVQLATEASCIVYQGPLITPPGKSDNAGAGFTIDSSRGNDAIRFVLEIEFDRSADLRKPIEIGAEEWMCFSM